MVIYSSNSAVILTNFNIFAFDLIVPKRKQQKTRCKTFAFILLKLTSIYLRLHLECGIQQQFHLKRPRGQKVQVLL